MTGIVPVCGSSVSDLLLEGAEMPAIRKRSLIAGVVYLAVALIFAWDIHSNVPAIKLGLVVLASLAAGAELGTLLPPSVM
ncbi:MAG TPA: hypothetical protein VFI41_10135 [Gemmatimonadales bacterium]|jgi:hypothetical protein|nr:hypothetical protein [Gemmatimonadales bacterium]